MHTEKQQLASMRNWRKAQLVSALGAIRHAGRYAKEGDTLSKFIKAADALLQAITAEYGQKLCPICKTKIDIFCRACNKEECWEALYTCKNKE